MKIFNPNAPFPRRIQNQMEESRYDYSRMYCHCSYHKPLRPHIFTFTIIIAGEIGIIKRDINFSGVVLNTAARIQSKCNEYDVKLLSSDELLQKLL